MNSNKNWIRLNVGGQVFQTSQATLTRFPDSFLAHLCDSQLPSDKDDTGAYLIDRDPTHFRTILNYLRGNVLHLFDTYPVEELLQEADFYGIPALIDDLKQSKRNGIKRVEIIIVENDDKKCLVTISMSDRDETIVNSLANKFRGSNLYTNNKGFYIAEYTHNFTKPFNVIWAKIQAVLRSNEFVLEKEEPNRWTFSRMALRKS